MEFTVFKMLPEIMKMRAAGMLTAKVLEAAKRILKPGITTLEIDEFCEDYIVNTLKAEPGSKGQYGFPHSVNTSVNHVVCHGWPNRKPLLKGDIVNLDITVRKDGYYGDSSVMVCVDSVSPQAKQLVDISLQCLYRGILAVKPGATIGDIGFAIDKHAKAYRYSVVTDYCGHGIGKKMHEDLRVPHVGQAGTGKRLKTGMTFTIEPMINQGSPDVKVLDDQWTVVTKDNQLSAQWEHTILVTDSCFEVLTLRDEEKEAFEQFKKEYSTEVQELLTTARALRK